MKRLRIAFVDVIGLKYHGNTVFERGLGGSESAVILMAKELAKLNFDITVYNNCETPGIYDDVSYHDLSILDQHPLETDIMIGSRTVVPFGDEPRYRSLQRSAKLKVLWMHDTFCGGDHLVEPYVMQGRIDEIFTLSDFHTNYITTCDHGGKRNFEVLKNKIWQTRNGINLYGIFDLSQKDPNWFVYNASVSKGMKPLLNDIWPRIKQLIPQAHLTIIGGYYKWDPAKEDVYEKDVKDLYEQHHGKNDVDFTGIIKQKEIADILQLATFFLYPGAFPETFGISTLEALAYGVVPITTRFGALEETAVDLASFKIDYAIEPNSLFPNIPKQDQINKFIAVTQYAHSNRYLVQQKQNYCKIVRDVATWDTVAIQWKQHFYRVLNMYMPVNQTRKANRINQRVQEIFGRRFLNKEDMIVQRQRKEKPIFVITPYFNASEYIERCIESVATQDYDNYHMILVDDVSTDGSYDAALNYILSLPKWLQERFTLIKNKKNVGAVRNQVDAIKNNIGEKDAIIMLLDGDDWLINDPNIFNKYNNMYQEENLDTTYGSCWSLADNIPLIAQDYPEDVKHNKSYRSHHFNWIIPYTHLRTFTKQVFDKMDRTKLLDENGHFYKAGGDGALFYAIIEECEPDKIKAVKDVVYMYNDLSPLMIIKSIQKSKIKMLKELLMEIKKQ